jgi:hypothetical protein
LIWQRWNYNFNEVNTGGKVFYLMSEITDLEK